MIPLICSESQQFVKTIMSEGFGEHCMYRIFGGRFILGPSNVKNKTALSTILDTCTNIYRDTSCSIAYSYDFNLHEFQ